MKVTPKRKKTATRKGSSVRLVIVLYDQLIEDISRADDALAHSCAEQCAKDIGHGLAVIGYLQAILQHGTHEVARNTDGVYTTLREKLIEAQVRSSRPILGQLKPQLMELREARAPKSALARSAEEALTFIPSRVHRPLQAECHSAGKSPRHNPRRSVDR